MPRECIAGRIHGARSRMPYTGVTGASPAITATEDPRTMAGAHTASGTAPSVTPTVCNVVRCRSAAQGSRHSPQMCAGPVMQWRPPQARNVLPARSRQRKGRHDRPAGRVADPGSSRARHARYPAGAPGKDVTHGRRPRTTDHHGTHPPPSRRSCTDRCATSPRRRERRNVACPRPKAAHSGRSRAAANTGQFARC